MLILTHQLLFITERNTTATAFSTAATSGLSVGNYDPCLSNNLIILHRIPIAYNQKTYLFHDPGGNMVESSTSEDYSAWSTTATSSGNNSFT